MVLEKKQGARSLSLPSVGFCHLPSYISELFKEKLDVLRQDSMLPSTWMMALNTSQIFPCLTRSQFKHILNIWRHPEENSAHSWIFLKKKYAYLLHWIGVSEHCRRTNLKETISMVSCLVSSFYSNYHTEGWGGKENTRKKKKREGTTLEPTAIPQASSAHQAQGCCSIFNSRPEEQHICNHHMQPGARAMSAGAKEETSSLLTHPVLCTATHTLPSPAKLHIYF